MPLLVGGPQPLAARQGRDNQRYGELGERLVAGCIPVCWTSPHQSTDTALVLMVSSRAGKGYAFPKGGWELDESLEDAARRETVEEAGVRGTLETPGLGRFDFSSSKLGRGGEPQRGAAFMFVLHVSEELQSWPESEERVREWVPLKLAPARCRYAWMRDALECWVAARGWPPLDPGRHSPSLVWTVGGKVEGDRQHPHESVSVAL
ncbi:DIPP1 [Auxenochlorella protothecoides x Auxenochlorella symbiontica]